MKGENNYCYAALDKCWASGLNLLQLELIKVCPLKVARGDVG
jgi:hypothetical protein